MPFDKNFIAVYKEVLRYIKKHYIPNKNNRKDAKFSMLNEFYDYEEEFGILLDIFNDEPKEKIVYKEKENRFCILIMDFCDNDMLRLKNCISKCHLTTSAYESIINKKFHPSKLCVYNFLIALKCDCDMSDKLLEATGFGYCKYNKFDVAMRFFSENRIYDRKTINDTLYLLDLPMLGHYFV